MEQLIKLFTESIDWTLVLLIVLSSFWVKKNFTEILPKLSVAVKIFFWSTILTVLYYYINFLTGMFELKDASSYIITYLFATSFYEIIAKPVLEGLKNLTGLKNEEPENE